VDRTGDLPVWRVTPTWPEEPVMTNDVPDRVPDEGRTDPRWRLSPTKILVGVILLVAIIVPLLVGTYSSVEPRLFGFPFFYWYQLLWVFIAAGLCGLSYLLLKRERLSYERDRDAAASRTGRSEGGSV
jgi:hypothetical protein